MAGEPSPRVAKDQSTAELRQKRPAADRSSPAISRIDKRAFFMCGGHGLQCPRAQGQSRPSARGFLNLFPSKKAVSFRHTRRIAASTENRALTIGIPAAITSVPSVQRGLAAQARRTGGVVSPCK